MGRANELSVILRSAHSFSFGEFSITRSGAALVGLHGVMPTVLYLLREAI